MYHFSPETNNPTFTTSVNNFLTKKEINYLLDNIENIPYSEGTIASEKENYSHNPRKSSIKWVPFEKKFNHFYQKSIDMISFYNSQEWKFKLDSIVEPFQYTEYSSLYHGKYDWHRDISKQHFSYRKISVTIQLSDPLEYKGGILELYDDNEIPNEKGFPIKQAEKQLGSATIFPSFIPHRVTPVTKGTRKSLVLWVGGCKFT